MKEKIDGCHRHDKTVFFAGFRKIPPDLVAFPRRRVNRYQVVIVQVHAPRANFPEHSHDLYGRDWWTNKIAEGITSAIAKGPKTKSKLMLRLGLILPVLC